MLLSISAMRERILASCKSGSSMFKSFVVASGATGGSVWPDISAASSALTAASFFSNQTDLPVPKDHHEHGRPHEHHSPISE